jgi:5-methylcytosine-specific restriction endonuclease McrA
VIAPDTRQAVRLRANDHCEYCRLPQAASVLSFHVDHIVAKQHLDEVVDDPEFLCLACSRCNAYKGPNLSSIDPATGEIVRLFHPREDDWDDHFELREGQIEARTAIGRATVRLLNMNAPQRVELREQWLGDQGENL